MNIIIHRGTHQIGGSAIEISTASTRIILDFGNELDVYKRQTCNSRFYMVKCDFT